ncbi:hypothetical protein M408DRAFT_326357 [Serendipita vermifera MAFF 305830]|uniref:Uncharacterized protein n=1 Tax=Serendipita vermifera MAFF 305830 TaxID=933852 RepID=A0A0C3BKH8_SERVB|nr:hypothetical protein M408DRAFT_326357 [Serendipita vermifera MAFF 305830]
MNRAPNIVAQSFFFKRAQHSSMKRNPSSPKLPAFDAAHEETRDKRNSDGSESRIWALRHPALTSERPQSFET